MLNALLVANAASAAGRKVRGLDLPGRWIYDPAAVTAEAVQEADLLALFGGDGTLQKTLSQLLRELPAGSLPPVALLPFGTTNMNATDLNDTRGRRACVASLARVIREGRHTSRQRSLVRVRDGNSIRHGFFFGMGAIADLASRWASRRADGALGNRLRILGAMLSGLRQAATANPIRLNGRCLSVYGLLATTLDRLLLGSTPYWGDGRPGDLRLTWVAAGTPHFLRNAPALLRGSPRLAGIEGYESAAMERADLELSGPYLLDGEIYQAGDHPLTIDRSAPLTWAVL